MKTKNPKTQSPNKDQKEFPGYPPYAPADDITHRAKRVEADLEDSSKDNIVNGAASTDRTNTIDETEESDKPKNEFDLTEEDLEALGPKDLSMDMGEDEELKHRTTPVDFSGNDLDVPGSEDDDASEAIGSEDEENNSYSIGGDRHEDLEEDRS